MLSHNLILKLLLFALKPNKIPSLSHIYYFYSQNRKPFLEITQIKKNLFGSDFPLQVFVSDFPLQVQTRRIFLGKKSQAIQSTNIVQSTNTSNHTQNGAPICPINTLHDHHLVLQRGGNKINSWFHVGGESTKSWGIRAELNLKKPSFVIYLKSPIVIHRCRYFALCFSSVSDLNRTSEAHNPNSPK